MKSREVKPITFTYRNWKGEVSERNVIPIKLWRGSTEFHIGNQLLLTAWDVDKKAERTFVVADIIHHSRQFFKSMTREEFKELMFNVRTAARLIEHDNLKGDEGLDKLFDTLKQVYYLNSINK